MVGKRDIKGKAPMRSVSIADEEYSPRSHSPRSRPASPGPSNAGRHASRGSPTPTHAPSPSRSQSQPNPERNQQATSAQASSTTAATAAATVGQQIPASRYTSFSTSVPQPYTNWRPYYGYAQGGVGMPYAPLVSPMGVATPQPAPPAPVNPPDELGPPPPPPPPPAIPPVLNPFGIHFQPQVPGTEMGPMTHRYVPRHDPPGTAGMFYPGQQMPGFMANGTMMPMMPQANGAMMPMMPLPMGGVAPITAPMNPIVIQQPGGQPMMIQSTTTMPGAPPFMLAGSAQAMQMPGNPPLIAGLPAQPPVHVEPAMGVGLTPNETVAQNIRVAQNNKAYEPQDFKPADPDPYRMYWFRELNHHWAVFSRRQIDRLNARWYRTDDGVFYAIRLSE